MLLIFVDFEASAVYKSVTYKKACNRSFKSVS